jgi:hypothetical protein
VGGLRQQGERREKENNDPGSYHLYQRLSQRGGRFSACRARTPRLCRQSGNQSARFLVHFCGRLSREGG